MGKIVAVLLGAWSGVAVAAAAGCPPPGPQPVPDASPPPPPVPVGDGGFTSICAAACSAVAAAGCAEGSAPNCARSLQAVETLRLNPNPRNGGLPVTCADLTAAKTAADVRAMGETCNGQK